MTILYLLGCLSVLILTGLPTVPTRGKFSSLCDGVETFAAEIAMAYLMFWVVDETHGCLRFVAKLGSDFPTVWPEKVYDKIRSIVQPDQGKPGCGMKAASAYVDVCFIGKLTNEAIPLVILPFAVLTLLILARWPFFANWHLSPLIIGIACTNAVVCVSCALLLKAVANEAKRRAIRSVGISAADARAAGANPLADSLEALQADMRANKEGAFLPWHQQPFVSAILLPFGGTGVLQIIAFFLSKK